MGEKQDEVKKNNEGEKKNEVGGGGGGPTTVVLKFDLHCEGCVKKIKHFLRKNFNGVETVKGDIESNKLTVVGKVEPSKIKEKVEQKIKKKVELISPLPNKEEGEKKGNEKKSGESKLVEVIHEAKKLDEKKDNKPKEPPVSTVVLKTRVHCDGCAQKMKKIVSKREGVKDVDVDLQKDTIIIKGTMNMKELLPYLNVKLKRVVELAPPPKKDDGDKKPKEGSGGGEKPLEKLKEGGEGGPKKPKEGGGGGSGGSPPEKLKESGGGSPPEKPKDDKGDKKEDGEKKKEVEGGEKKSLDNGGEVGITQENTTRIEINKMEYSGYPHGGYEYGPGYGYNYTYDPRQYGEGSSSHQVVQYWHQPGDSHPPQIFSDENPNACFIM